MEISFDHSPRSFRHGFEGADEIAGICAVLARPLPVSALAKPNAVETRLANTLARLISPNDVLLAPILSTAALHRNTHPFVWLLSHLPALMLRLAIRAPFTQRLLSERARLLPVLPVSLSVEPSSVQLREQIDVVLSDRPARAPSVTKEGSLGLTCEIDGAKLHEARHRYRRILGKLPPPRMRAAFLLLEDRPRADWKKSSDWPTPRSRSVVEIADLTKAVPPLIENIADKDLRLAPVELSIDLPFTQETKMDDGSFGEAVSIAVSPEHGQDPNAILISVTATGSPKSEALGELKIRSVTITIPPIYPPIEETSAQRRGVRGRDEVTEKSETVSEDRHTWTARFPAPFDLLHGKALVLRLRCKREAVSIWERGGHVTITAACSYSKSLSDITQCHWADHFGRLPKTSFLPIQAERTITFNAKLNLEGHAFLGMHTVTERFDAPDFHPDRAFAQSLTDRLMDARILVRRVLESQLTSYEGRATPFECSLFGRVEKSMASPDIHIRIQSQRQPSVEITVSGKFRNENDRRILEETAKEIADLARELATPGKTPAPAENSADQSEDGVSSELRLARIEQKLDKISSLMASFVDLVEVRK